MTALPFTPLALPILEVSPPSRPLTPEKLASAGGFSNKVLDPGGGGKIRDGSLSGQVDTTAEGSEELILQSRGTSADHIVITPNIDGNARFYDLAPSPTPRLSIPPPRRCSTASTTHSTNSNGEYPPSYRSNYSSGGVYSSGLLTPTTLYESPTSSTMSFADADQEEQEESTNEEGGPNDIVYHIYHSGKMGQNYSIHEIRNAVVFPKKKKKKENEKAKEKEGDEGGIQPDELPIPSLYNPDPSAPPQQKKKTYFPSFTSKIGSLEDPRRPTYYLHTPRYGAAAFAQTLRWGGGGLYEQSPGSLVDETKERQKRDLKYAPVVCTIKGSLFWKKWRIEFMVKVPPPTADPSNKPPSPENWVEKMKERKPGKKDKSNYIYANPNSPGVMDGRGILSHKCPVKKRFLWGYYSRGETGKRWIEEEAKRVEAEKERLAEIKKKRRKSTTDIASANEAATVIDATNLPISKAPEPILPLPSQLPLHLLPISLSPPTPTSPPDLSESTIPHPSMIELKWVAKDSREYSFTYLGYEFYWKGTRKVQELDEKKRKGPDLCRWNHLKLVIVLPESDDENSLNGATEVGVIPDPETGKIPPTTSSLLRRTSSFLSLSRSPTHTTTTSSSTPSPSTKHLILARYQSSPFPTKCGKLALFNTNIAHASRTVFEKSPAKVIPTPDMLDGNNENSNIEVEDAQQNEYRLRHIITSTALCMIIGEKQKRDLAREIVLLLLTGAGDGGM